MRTQSMFEFLTGEAEKIFMEWSDRYATGSKALDDDHRNLFNIVNHYYTAVHHGEAQVSLDAILDLIDKYIQQHFAREERLMSELGFRHLVEHKKMHIDLTKAFRATRLSYHLDPGDFDADAFLLFMQTWLTRHILVEDHKLTPYIKRESLTRKQELSS